MKIYTRVVLDMSTGGVLEEDSYEYEGPIAECKGSGDNEVKETDEERELARIATEQWNDYQTRFVPVENAFIDQARVTEGDRSYLEGAAAGAVQRQYTDAERKLAERYGITGVKPGSGAWSAGMTALDAGRASARGLNVTNAGENATDLHYRGLDSVIGMGRGQANQAQLGLGQAAGAAVSEASSKAMNDQYEDAAASSAIGTAAGMGLRQYQK